MLIGIIKNQNNNNNYFIHLDNNELSIIETTKDTVKALTKQEVISLFKTIFSSKLTYKEKYNDYDIYLDENNNKRYFKNGIENIFMFLENNGENAIKYLEKIDKNYHPSVKKYNILIKAVMFEIIFSTVSLIPFAGDIKIREVTDYALSSCIPLSTNEMINLINNSRFLEEEEKEYLANENYFNFVLSNTESNTREYYLRNSLNNVRIKNYNQDTFPTAQGFYNPLNINCINIADNIDDEYHYKDVMTHEFIHMTQDQNKYLYIIEASAEILEHEFYNQPCDGYPELVKRVKVLMEIIGPQPIIDCNFKGDTTSFEDSIKMYLDEQDAEQLLFLFSSSTNSLYESEETMILINTQIDVLLSKMYTNKTGKKMSDDLMIKLIYISNTSDRIYFNKELDEYSKEYYLFSEKEEIGELEINDVVNSNAVEYYSYSVETVKEVDGDTICSYSNETTTNFDEIPTEGVLFAHVLFKDGTQGLITYDQINNQWRNIKHYKMVNKYEPSIPKKFPSQIKKPINNKEISEKIEDKVKSI